MSNEHTAPSEPVQTWLYTVEIEMEGTWKPSIQVECRPDHFRKLLGFLKEGEAYRCVDIRIKRAFRKHKGHLFHFDGQKYVRGINNP